MRKKNVIKQEYGFTWESINKQSGRGISTFCNPSQEGLVKTVEERADHSKYKVEEKSRAAIPAIL